MTNPAPLTCTYCGATSTWSAEHTDTTELPEVHPCTSCGHETTLCDLEVSNALHLAENLTWAAPEPLN